MLDVDNSKWAARIATALPQVEGQFREMPGLRLTERQAARLCALDARTCRAVLAHLVASGFLVEIRGAVFARASEVDGTVRSSSPRLQAVESGRSARTHQA